MRKTASFVFGASAAALLLAAVVATPNSAEAAGGKVPDEKKVCKNKENPPSDAVTKGGCVVVDRRKGNCLACHMMAGADEINRQTGNYGPPLVAIKQRFPDKSKLKAQVSDARKMNPHTVMPPFGPHAILSGDEIDNVVEFLYTL